MPSSKKIISHKKLPLFSNKLPWILVDKRLPLPPLAFFKEDFIGILYSVLENGKDVTILVANGHNWIMFREWEQNVFGAYNG